jgi:hypothetical protein
MKHCEENGKPDNHDQAREILAGMAGVFIGAWSRTRHMHFGVQ